MFLPERNRPRFTPIYKTGRITVLYNLMVTFYNRCTESGYIVAKFILLDERESLIWKVCEWQIMGATGQ
jgi:hypothetical protein